MGHLPLIKASGSSLAPLLALPVRCVHMGNVEEEMERKEAICRPPLAICRPPPWSTPATATSLPSAEGKKVVSTESVSWKPMGDLWGRPLQELLFLPVFL